MIGETVSHYRIVSRAGRGGMGVVYVAEDTRLKRKVALKFLSADSIEEQDKARFLHEAQTAARLSHPNICPIYEVDEADGRLFFAMAYLEGQTLSRLAASGPLPVPLALDLAIQIAEGLEEAHANGVVHRDIKSANILVNARNHAYILDFGIALSSGVSRLTMPGGVLGTPGYMSPEQAAGRDLDGRTDIWSLGAVLFEMLSGKRPFERDRDLSVVYAILNDAAPSLLTLRPELPPELARAVNRALAKRLEERWRTARQLADELRRIRDGGYARAEETPTVTALDAAAASITPEARPNRRRMSAALAAAAALVAAAVWFWTSHAGGDSGVKHLAVLPFEVTGPASESMRAISDGLVETLTSTLGQAEEFERKLLIVPASEIRSRKISSAEEARRIYGVNLVMSGNAQWLGEAVQFNINLIDVVTMRQLGARSFDFDARNPIEVRNAAVGHVWSLLNVQLSAAAKRGQESGTSTPAAYTEFLKARGYLARYDVPGNLDRAVEGFENVTRLDPRYALAFALLGEAYWRRALASSDKQWAGRAIEAASQAVKLDPKLAIAHAKLGEIYSRSGRREEAAAELRTALRLEPGSAEAHRGLAGVYVNMGRFQEAEQSLLHVTRSRPTDWYAFLMLGVFYWDRHRYQLAEAAFQRAAQLTPENDIVHRNMAGLFVTTGRYRKAQAESQKAVTLKPSARAYSTLGLAYYFDRRYPEAAAALETSVDLDSGYYVGWGNLGSAYRWAPGGQAKARAALSRAVELARKRLDITPDDYNVRANLAEYRAKLGEPDQALAEIALIPEASRATYWANIALAYKLSGRRQPAIDIVAAALSGSAQPHEVRDEPDLADLMTEPAILRAAKLRGN